METIIAVLKKGIPYVVYSNDSKGETPQQQAPYRGTKGWRGCCSLRGGTFFYLERHLLIKSSG